MATTQHNVDVLDLRRRIDAIRTDLHRVAMLVIGPPVNSKPVGAESLRTKTTAELIAIKRQREFTTDERAVLFGDPSASTERAMRNRDDELVRRLDAGEPLTAADRKDARRIKRSRVASEGK